MGVRGGGLADGSDRPSCLGVAGAIGDDGGSLNTPTGVCVHAGRLYVSSHMSHCVQVFDRRSQAHLQRIGGHGAAPGLFQHPRCVAISRDLLFVTEQRRVQVLALHGEPRQCLVLTHPRSRSPMNLWGCAVCERSGRLLVTDEGTHKVLMLPLRRRVM